MKGQRSFREKGEGRLKTLKSGVPLKMTVKKQTVSIGGIQSYQSQVSQGIKQDPNDVAVAIRPDQRLEEGQNIFSGKEDVVDNMIDDLRLFDSSNIKNRSIEVEVRLLYRQDPDDFQRFNQCLNWLKDRNIPNASIEEFDEWDYVMDSKRPGYKYRYVTRNFSDGKTQAYAKIGKDQETEVLPAIGNHIPRIGISIETSDIPFNTQVPASSSRTRRRWKFPITSQSVLDLQLSPSLWGDIIPYVNKYETFSSGTIDLTQTVTQSGNVTYEIEIEVDPKTITTMKTRERKEFVGVSSASVRNETYLGLSESQKDLLSTWSKILITVMDRSGIHMTTSMRESINHEFNKSIGMQGLFIVETVVNKPEDLQLYDLSWLSPEASKMFMTSKNWDQTPQNIVESFKSDRVFKPIFSIDGGYYISLKADGTRYFLFFSESGIFIISPLSRVMTKLTGSGTKYPSHRNILTGTILDVELIGDIQPGGVLDEYKFLAFDILSDRGKDVRMKTYTERLRHVEEVVNFLSTGNSVYDIAVANQANVQEGHIFATMPFETFFIIRSKPVYRLPDMQSSLKLMGDNVTEDDKFLACRELAKKFFETVGKISEASTSSKIETGPIVWTSDGTIYTPAERPYLEPDGTTLVRKWKLNITIDLKVIRNPTTHKLEVFTTNYAPSKGLHNVSFEALTSGQVEKNARAKYETRRWNGNVELDDDLEDRVVEFEWKYSEKFSDFALVPFSIREDRRNPNPASIVSVLWNLINDPITLDHLYGKKLDLMGKYHNRVKTHLINDLKNKSVGTLLDLGSGKGGDRSKWFGLDMVYAVEPDVENLREFVSRSRRLPSISITTVPRSNSEHYSQKINLLARSKVGPIEGKKNIKIINAGAEDINTLKSHMGSVKVQAITMFNALTFFYESREKLNTLIETLKTFLKDGGYFYTIAFDGEMFMNTLRNHPEMQFMISDDQETPTLPKIRTENITIQKIGDPSCRKIWIRIEGGIVRGQYEYLINVREFVSIMESEGFHLLEERYLDEEHLLSEEEYWFSSCFKLMKFRSFSNTNKRELSPFVQSKLQSMEATRVISPLLPDDPPQRFQSTQLAQLGITGLLRNGNLQDGSCFVHGCLNAFLAPYKNLMEDGKRGFVIQLRKELAEKYTREYHDSFGDGFFASTQMPSYRYETVKASLGDSTFWIPSYLMDFICDHLNVNVYILRGLNAEVYKFGESMIHTKPGRNNIVLYWINDNHYETVGLLMPGNEMRTAFPDDHPLIVAIRSLV